jgi:L-amino acid N-acyltransferase YncA
MTTTIRAAGDADWPWIWGLFQQVMAAGHAYAYDEHTPESAARHLWIEPPASPFVAEVDGRLAGAYFLRPNQPGRGAHVANAGYMVAAHAQGRGLAREMCEHSLAVARSQGFRAMQFNFVVSTNAAAVRTWEQCGFAVVGRVPGAFRHATLGFVDTLIFHRAL